MKLKNAIYADWIVPANIVAFSTSRIGGVSEAPYASLNIAKHVGDKVEHVMANRALLSEKLSPQLRWQWLQQVHGTDVASITKPKPEITADALLTRSPNLVCCVQTADCLPVYLAAKDGTEVAIVHAGWRGLAAGIVENAISSMWTPATEIVAWLGPAIGPCHFEVGAEVKEAFLYTEESAEAESALESCFKLGTGAGKFMADLYAIAKFKLRQQGVAQVSGGDHCTHCEKDQLFSFRRDGLTGRMLNAIYIET